MKVTNEQITEAINRSNGFLSKAAESLNVTRQTIFLRIQKSKKLAEAIKDIQEKLLDFSESKLMENIKAGKEASIFFHLKCKGKSRGYVERHEVTGSEGKPLEIKIYLPDNGRGDA